MMKLLSSTVAILLTFDSGKACDNPRKKNRRAVTEVMMIRYLLMSECSRFLFFPKMNAVHKNPRAAVINKIMLLSMSRNINKVKDTGTTPDITKIVLQSTCNMYKVFQKKSLINWKTYLKKWKMEVKRPIIHLWSQK